MHLTFKNVGKSFGDRVILESITWEEEFASLAMIGPSGAGKSTLLRLVAGLLKPTSGDISINGLRVVYEEKALRQHLRTIGFVFQSKGLFEHLTAVQNLMLPLIHAFGYSKKDAELQAERLFNRFGLAAEKNKYPSQLSGGQQQRIAIARAVAVKPNLLLLDEPTSALDPEYTVEVLDMLGELQQEGIAMIIVTHEMGFAKKACEKLMFIAEKTILESGNSKDLFAQPQSAALQGFLNKVLEWTV